MTVDLKRLEKAIQYQKELRINDLLENSEMGEFLSDTDLKVLEKYYEKHKEDEENNDEEIEEDEEE